MSVKSNEKGKTVVKEIEFPKLMVMRSKNFVVLMTSMVDGVGNGTVVMTGGGCWEVGYHCDNWGSNFTDYVGTIELTNEVG